jgi:hypothetical protein
VSAAITTLVILIFIGCGPLPNGAVFHNKKQAILPKQAPEIKLIKRELSQPFESKKIVCWHLHKSIISFPSSLFSPSYVILKNLISRLSPQKQAMSCIFH